MSGLVFPVARTPVVSIVMPVHGGWEWTVRALGAVLANTDETYEMIVVDDASPDSSLEALTAAVQNVHLVRSPKNVGFGASCNQGAAVARGEFLVFLNSDALVHRRWIAPLLETAARDARIGAVGPCFLNLDGTLQEAGGLLFRDGWTAAYGNGSPADRAEFRRPRLVDYVSAACLMVGRRAFGTVGGFDPVYGMAYYEDVDLCLRLAGKGLQTVYEPRSLVTHVLGGSSAAPARARELAKNRPVFARRWSEILSSRPHIPGGIEEILAARDAPASDRILVLAPAFGGAESGRRELARELARLCPSAHLAFVDDAQQRRATEDEELTSLGIETFAGGFGDVEEWLTARLYHYDVVILGSPTHPFAPLIRATQPQAWRIVKAQPMATTDRKRRATAEVEIRAADAILLPSESAKGNAGRVAPAVPAFVVSHDGGFRGLVDLLSHAGVAVSAEYASA